MTKVRLQKLLSERGIASRRSAEKLIEAGRVQLNGDVVTTLGTQVDPNLDQIKVDQLPIPPAPKLTTYLLNKPRGYVCSRVAQGKERLVTGLVPGIPTVYPVGRLDKESEGLILLSNDGQLTYQLTHPSYTHNREYKVEISWKSSEKPEPNIADLTIKMLNGVRLSDGKFIPDALKIDECHMSRRLLTIQVHEGRHHLIRRFCASFGYRVHVLKRTAIGKLRDDKLKPGQSRLISQTERKLFFSHAA